MSTDRLPSWSDGAAKAAILDFVAGVIQEGGIALIRYQSVRDPGHGGCTALLTPAGFAGKSPKGAVQTWWLSVRQDRSTWIRGNQRHEFEFA